MALSLKIGLLVDNGGFAEVAFFLKVFYKLLSSQLETAAPSIRSESRKLLSKEVSYHNNKSLIPETGELLVKARAALSFIL